jgi:hypothetical protein
MAFFGKFFFSLHQYNQKLYRYTRMASETKTKAKVVKLKLCFGQKPNKPQKM